MTAPAPSLAEWAVIRRFGIFAPEQHAEAVADSGDAYTVERRRPWHLSCLWCEYETTGHPTKRAALVEMTEHYTSLLPGWWVR